MSTTRMLRHGLTAPKRLLLERAGYGPVERGFAVLAESSQFVAFAAVCASRAQHSKIFKPSPAPETSGTRLFAV